MHVVYELPMHEYHRYRAHLLNLDKESRYLRFGHHVSDEVINALCDKWESNLQRHRVFVIEDDELAVVAAGHVSLETRPIELAFSVLEQYQGQGMGNSLLGRVVEWCQNRGLKDGCMVCLQHNTAMKRLAQKHGILITDCGETLAKVHIPNANAVSIIHEAAVDNIAKFDHLGKLQRHFARMLAFPLQFLK